MHIARIVNVEIYECVNFIFLFPRRGDLDLTRVTSHGNRRCEYTAEALAKNFSNPPSILFFSARIVRFSRARMMRFSLEGRQ